ncbi:GntP family permease [Escherichia albertii]|uniref:GntP family permease n=1 Tax=Escherichia albertii TaxID=208962 RepID=UPI0007439C27|nr:GntP family permease [Escherichia albertii]MCE7710687.1 GntP family permease [Escherichia albertii]MCU7290977.1 GntP family permease [Escherichia albertii]MCZ7511499.1 GntP family permease [Escherichia albertii]MCZ8859813.1 GntP family permease [Escherichia albertii]QTA17410.1 GntP family permease [Escherichia albertii]
MGIICLIIGLFILMAMCMKGIHVFIAVFVTSLFLATTAWITSPGTINPLDTILKVYTAGVGGYFGNFFFIFVLGAIFGKLTAISGAADSVASFIIGKFGQKAVIPSLVAACAILAYGGVSVFVALFTVYSMMVSLFRKANLPRRLIPAVYFAGAGTFVMIMPGSPQIQNLIPMKYLGTSATAGLVPGMLTALFQVTLVVLYLSWLFKRVRANGEGWQEDEKSAKAGKDNATRTLPHVVVALLPMLVLLVVLNILKWDPAIALFSAIIAALVVYLRYLDWKAIVSNLAAGTMEGVMSLFNTAVIVGFGALVMTLPAFQQSFQAIVHSGLSPLMVTAISVGALVFISGSGSGALSVAMPLIASMFPATVVDQGALHRVATMSCMSTTPPFNGLIVTVLSVCGVSHKEGYGPVGILTLAIPLIAMCFMLLLYAVLPASITAFGG